MAEHRKKCHLDNHRRNVELKLQETAREFATKYGMLEEVDKELAWKADNRNERYWQNNAAAGV